MIQLTESEKTLIKITKGHFKEKYPFKGKWVQTFKPYFIEIYGWNPDENNQYEQYLNVLFERLLDLQLMICDDMSGNNLQICSIFNAAFYKSIIRTDEKPIERAIAALCGLIQCNTVINDNGDKRYEL